MNIASALVLFTFAAATTLATPVAQQQHVYLAVTNESGASIRDLTARDLQLQVDGQTVDVLGVAPASDPIAAVVVADMALGNLTLGVRSAMRDIVTALGQTHPGSRVGLMLNPGSQAPVMRSASDDVAELDAEISHFVVTDNNSPLLESLMVASDTLSKESSPRRVVIMIGAQDSNSATNTVAPQRVLDALRKAKASFWAIDMVRPTRMPTSDEDRVLDIGPRASGGSYALIQISELKDQVSRLMDTIAGQYLVTYTHERVGGPGVLRVGVSRKGATIMAPAWTSTQRGQ